MNSYFFNAVPTTDLSTHPTGYDRNYDADDHAAFFAPLFSEAGVFGGSGADACKVRIQSGYTLAVSEGAVYVRGRMAVFDGTETITVSGNCRIVVRMDKSMDVRDFRLMAVSELTRTEDVYDLELAAVTLVAVTGGHEVRLKDTRSFVSYMGQPPYYPPDSDSLPYMLWLYTLGFPMTAEQRADVEGNPALMAIYRETAAQKHAAARGNPHEVTAKQARARPDTWVPSAADVGAVAANKKATSAQAKAGADDTAWMTPARTKEACSIFGRDVANQGGTAMRIKTQIPSEGGMPCPFPVQSTPLGFISGNIDCWGRCKDYIFVLTQYQIIAVHRTTGAIRVIETPALDGQYPNSFHNSNYVYDKNGTLVNLDTGAVTSIPATKVVITFGHNNFANTVISNGAAIQYSLGKVSSYNILTGKEYTVSIALGIASGYASRLAAMSDTEAIYFKRADSSAEFAPAELVRVNFPLNSAVVIATVKDAKIPTFSYIDYASNTLIFDAGNTVYKMNLGTNAIIKTWKSPYTIKNPRQSATYVYTGLSNLSSSGFIPLLLTSSPATGANATWIYTLNTNLDVAGIRTLPKGVTGRIENNHSKNFYVLGDNMLFNAKTQAGLMLPPAAHTVVATDTGILAGSIHGAGLNLYDYSATYITGAYPV